MDRIRYEAQVNVGSVISPFNAWQIFRGSVTFPLRMQRINESTQKITEWLEQRENVTFVSYPGLRSNPGHDESLIFPQPSYDERIHLYPEKFRKGFIRFSVGLGDPEDIIGDLDQALRSVGL